MNHSTATRHLSTLRPDRTKLARTQNGVGLIEVLISLVILAVGALAIANLHTASNVAMRNSADYFKLNELSYSVIENLKADSANAQLGAYNTEYTQTVASPTAPATVSKKINSWKNAVANIVPLGEMQIDCASSECLVSLRWYETSSKGSNSQVYNVRSPI